MLSPQGLSRSILNGTCLAGQAFRRARIGGAGGVLSSGEKLRSAMPPRRAGLSRRRAFRHIGRSRSAPYTMARELEGGTIEAGVMGLAAVFAAVIVLAGSSR